MQSALISLNEWQTSGISSAQSKQWWIFCDRILSGFLKCGMMFMQWPLTIILIISLVRTLGSCKLFDDFTTDKWY